MVLSNELDEKRSAHHCRYMHEEKDINQMNLNELQVLESNLEIWVNNIRSQKVIISMPFSIGIKTFEFSVTIF
jgi:hypothetical protein